MHFAKNLPLFDNPHGTNGESPYSGRELGTFKDSLRAPIHRWFRYPAGYSYKFVFETFDMFSIGQEDWVYDPFSGTGTTLICAKQHNVNAYGVEAHEFVHWVASVKLYWDFDYQLLSRQITQFLDDTSKYVRSELPTVDLKGVFPELVYKCYHPQDLRVLYLIREQILEIDDNEDLQNLLKLALTDTLRGSAAAGTGWPYIAPNKNTGDKPPRDALHVFKITVTRMYEDLRSVASSHSATIQNILGDSREEQSLSDGQARLALTSPPYLNNYDYGDRTRLETYFWGLARTWSDISRQYRDKLMVAATTQINRGQFDVESTLSNDILEMAPHIYHKLQKAITQLSERRLEKGGKKDYDLVVALYFNDILAVLQETYRILAKGGHFVLVLGDSAPYGVHIPTEDFIGRLGEAVGFSRYDYHQLRTRGGKWKKNPQRHTVPLREGIVVLSK